MSDTDPIPPPPWDGDEETNPGTPTALNELRQLRVEVRQLVGMVEHLANMVMQLQAEVRRPHTGCAVAKALAQQDELAERGKS